MNDDVDKERKTTVKDRFGKKVKKHGSGKRQLLKYFAVSMRDRANIKNMGLSEPLFDYFRPFLIVIQI